MVRGIMAFLLTTFLSVSVSASHSRSRAPHKGLGKRVAEELGFLNDLKLFTRSRWTFYDAELGACGVTNNNNDSIVALNAIQFGLGYPGPQCFKKITMEYNGKKTTATIMDMCPECPYGALDLSRGLFDYFAREDEGVIYGQWHFGEDSRPGDNEEEHPPAPTKIEDKPSPPTHTKAYAPDSDIPPPRDPVRKCPKATQLSRPLNQSGTQQPASEKDANLLPPARIPSGPNTGFTARPNGEIIIGSEMPPNTVILTPPTSNALKDTPIMSDYVSDNGSEQSENLVELNMIYGRLGSIAAAGSATNNDE